MNIQSSIVNCAFASNFELTVTGLEKKIEIHRHVHRSEKNKIHNLLSHFDNQLENMMYVMFITLQVPHLLNWMYHIP